MSFSDWIGDLIDDSATSGGFWSDLGDWAGDLIDDSAGSGGFWSDLGSWALDEVTDLGGWLKKDNNLSGILTLLGSGAIANSSLGDPRIEKTGYQGGIPNYTAVRERLPEPVAPEIAVEPLPGSVAPTMGRRYFTDMEYLLNQVNGDEGNGGGDNENIGDDMDALIRETDTGPPPPGGPGGPPEEAEIFDSGTYYAQGGIVGLMRGDTDGLSDKVPAKISGIEQAQPAALSDGEFVIPADIVSHLGNGNTEAGAEVLYAMMDRIRARRTGTSAPSKKINPKQVLPV